MDQEEQIIKLTAVEHRAESNTRRIDKLEQQTEALTSIATSVELLVAEQRHQTEAMMDIKNDVTALDKKVDAIEQQPAKRWESMVTNIVSLLVGGIIAFIFTQLGM